MYLYNTTFVIEHTEIDWWYDWMKRIYLPTFFELVPNANNELYKVDGNAQAPGCHTFSCQWKCYTLQELGTIQKYNKILTDKLVAEKGEKCLSFSTMMKSVEL